MPGPRNHPETAAGRERPTHGHPRPAPQLGRRTYGVAGGVFFGSIRMIQSPLSMSLT